MVHIISAKRPPRPTHPTFTENLWALMQCCWDQDPCSRPEASEVSRVLTLSLCQDLISHSPTIDERIHLITTIFSGHDQAKVVRQVSGDDAQTIVDVIAGVRVPTLFHTRKSALVQISTFFSIRRWMVSRQRFAEDVCAVYTRFVAAKPWFRNHWRFRFVTIWRKTRCTMVSLRTCGRVDTMARMLRQRF